MDAEVHPLATVYGYPRQGAHRELKRAIEGYWQNKSDAAELLATTKALRLQRLREMADGGLGEVPSNDFSLYDHVLDTSVMLNAIPERHLAAVRDVSTPQTRLERYFAMARGTSEVQPLEMTKWFDTNYHYLVPELSADSTFALDATKPLEEFEEALAAGIVSRPVVLGPVSFLLLAKHAPGTDETFSPLSLLDRVLPCYVELLAKLKDAGAVWVQLDEPALVTDQSDAVLAEFERAYRLLTEATARPKVLLATYFDQIGTALARLAATPIEGFGLDFTGPGLANLDLIPRCPDLRTKRLVAGVVDGRNIWTTDLDRALRVLENLQASVSTLDVGASCSLLHVPIDVDLETELDPEIRPWLSFARQKLAELATLRDGLAGGRSAIADALEANKALLAARASSPLVHVAAVRERTAGLKASDAARTSDYAHRHEMQQARLSLPKLPMTTIGSFPQTGDLRKARADLSKGKIGTEAYEDAMRNEIRTVVELQEELGIDVLVHGEPERNDMVQYFAEQLDGFIATANGWVQSYGTRYVRPPIVLGDVARPAPMTIEWARYAQSLTERPMKGMLTGPVTMLAWSFVRDDQPVGDTARQVALALRDEVDDLEEAGIAVIQVDEPALRELLPLRTRDRAAYLDWAVESFKIATSGVRDDTQIHTHMCYAEFGDVLDAIIAMDADVISLEAARSDMEIVADLARASYPNEVGPGVWDIHSPRVPPTDEIAGHLRSAIKSFPIERLWVNPDCGLKTRGYAEVRESLEHLAAATHEVRKEL